MPKSNARLAEAVEAVEVVLFDLDGTLIDTLELILASMRHTTDAVLGITLPDEVLMHNVGVPLIVQMREFAEYCEVEPALADEMLLVYREHNARVHDVLVKEYEGVEPALERIMATGRRLGIVTSKARAIAQRGLDRFSLDRFFDIIVSYDDVPIHKPDPHPLLFAAESLGVPIDRCAYVGDSPHDMTAAVAAGCIAVAAAWGVAGAERVLAPGPDLLAHNMEEVALIFEGQAQRFGVDS